MEERMYSIRLVRRLTVGIKSEHAVRSDMPVRVKAVSPAQAIRRAEAEMPGWEAGKPLESSSAEG